MMNTSEKKIMNKFLIACAFVSFHFISPVESSVLKSVRSWISSHKKGILSTTLAGVTSPVWFKPEVFETVSNVGLKIVGNNTKDVIALTGTLGCCALSAWNEKMSHKLGWMAAGILPISQLSNKWFYSLLACELGILAAINYYESKKIPLKV